MKFYDFLRGVAVAIIWTINGRITYMNRDKLPKDDNYVLVGPHRTWWDPVWYAVAAYPKHFIFMAKIELLNLNHWPGLLNQQVLSLLIVKTLVLVSSNIQFVS